MTCDMNTTCKMIQSSLCTSLVIVNSHLEGNPHYDLNIINMVADQPNRSNMNVFFVSSSNSVKPIINKPQPQLGYKKRRQSLKRRIHRVVCGWKNIETNEGRCMIPIAGRFIMG